ncbi:MAG: transglycosylase family protein [Actinomycetota bacterium]
MVRRPSGADTAERRLRVAFWTVVTAVLAVGLAGLLTACMGADAAPDEPNRDRASPARVESPLRATPAVWHKLAHCESRGNWHINSGNGFTGGLQFLDSTWLANGGGEFAPSAYLAMPEQQIVVAERLRDHVGGFSHWPACAAALGLP